jgi:fatty acid desaturase
MFMHVPCWKLPTLHRAVHTRPEGQRMEVAGGYAEVLRAATARRPETDANPVG